MSSRWLLLRALALPCMAALLAACSDRLPSGSIPGADPIGRAKLTLHLRCEVQAASGKMRCGTLQTNGDGTSRSLVYGGQGRYVELASSNFVHDELAELVQFDATVKNLLLQPIGTADGVTLHPEGVRVFFEVLPYASVGSGIVTLDNPDGFADVTGVAQPYFQYDEVLDTDETSDPKTWQFNIPSTVEKVSFGVAITTEAPYPSGWVAVTPDTIQLGVGVTQPLTADPRNAFNDDTVTDGPFTWTSSDTTVARVDASGVVRGVAPGTAFVSASSATRPGRFTALVTVAPIVPLASVSPGRLHTCALSGTGQALCWGQGTDGKLGIGSTAQQPTPDSVLHPPGISFVRVGAGTSHSCALGTSGQAYCWGAGTNGRLGDGSGAAQTTPTSVQHPAGVTFTQLSVGSHHTCALTSAGQAWCWGWNLYGQLGDNSVADRAVPTAVQQPAGVSFTSIVTGEYHTCAPTGAGQTWCWGLNSNGQVGDNTTTSRRVPTAVQQPAGVTFLVLSADYRHTCGLTTPGQMWCWGRNNFGQLGDNSTTSRRVPVAVQQSALTFTGLATGREHTCGLTSGGFAYCWGSNVSGELGDGTAVNQPLPVAVQQPGGLTFSSIGTDFSHTCAVGPGDQLWCWGLNGNAQLGDSTTANRNRPVPVWH